MNEWTGKRVSCWTKKIKVKFWAGAGEEMV